VLPFLAKGESRIGLPRELGPPMPSDPLLKRGIVTNKERNKMDDNVRTEIEIPIGLDDIRMFQELIDGLREKITWVFVANTGEDIEVIFEKEEVEDE